MKKLIQASIFFLPITLMANVAAAETNLIETAGDHGHHIPWGTIGAQAINLGILLVILFFATRKTIVAAFAARRSQYTDQAQKTAEAMKIAEMALTEIKQKLTTLENTQQESFKNAEQEAQSLKNKIVAESNVQSQKIKEDVSLIVSAEIYKAKTEIRNEIIQFSLEKAKADIQKSAESITKKSEKGFLEDLSHASGQVSV